MNITSSISFLSASEKITMLAFKAPRELVSHDSYYKLPCEILSELVGRVAAGVLLSSSALIDIALHTAFILPTFVYSLGCSIYQQKLDLILPWQHIQRVRNAVAPLFLGSAFGLIHPYLGIAVAEPADKHIAFGVLARRSDHIITPCSPLQSLSLIERLALENQYVEEDGVRKEIISSEHLKLIRDAKNFEKILEIFQFQEFVHKIMNTTRAAMVAIGRIVEGSNFSNSTKEILFRFSFTLFPVLGVVDFTLAVIAQAFFFSTDIIQTFFGRGPMYTEVSNNLFMQISFFIQNVLKLSSNFVGSFVGLISPLLGLKIGITPTHTFFNMQIDLLLAFIKNKMDCAEDNDRFAIPIVYPCANSLMPFEGLHMTYLIVEKKDEAFNLYWVNRPDIISKKRLDTEECLDQIRSMISLRFPFMNIEKIMQDSVSIEYPKIRSGKSFKTIKCQGLSNNCMVSNLFGMLQALDVIKEEDQDKTKLRHKTVRKSLMKAYGFYKGTFNPWGTVSECFSYSRNLFDENYYNMEDEI